MHNTPLSSARGMTEEKVEAPWAQALNNLQRNMEAV